MSDGLIGSGTVASPVGDGAVLAVASARRRFNLSLHRGVGMLEFLVALLIFSVGMIGLMSAQLTGKKASFDASQRSIATALVRDIVERMRANPGHTMAYQVAGAGDESSRLPRPDADCAVAECSAEQLAAFDLWQWESLLVGESEQDAVGNAGGLVVPRACISSAGGEVDVVISWYGVTRTLMNVEPLTPAGCDERSGELPLQAPGDERQRHQISMSTFIARR